MSLESRRQVILDAVADVIDKYIADYKDDPAFRADVRFTFQSALHERETEFRVALSDDFPDKPVALVVGSIFHPIRERKE